MRTNFTEDKRIMQSVQEPPATGPAPSSNITTLEDQALAAEMVGKTADQIAAIIARGRALSATRGVADRNAGVAGSSQAQAAAAAQTTGVRDTQVNADRAASATQDLIKQNLLIPQTQFNQAVTNLMNSENSIEQMKAGFSGMLEVLGIVAKRLGADEFGQGCLDLARDLRPKAVLPNADILARIEGLRSDLNVDPALTQGSVDQGVNSALETAARVQTSVDAAASAGVDAARTVTQPTVFDGATPRARPIASTAITVGAFDTAANRLMGGSNPILLASEATTLQEQFTAFAARGGQPDAIDTATEKASLAMAIRTTVQNPNAENQLIQSLGLQAPRPGSSNGF